MDRLRRLRATVVRIVRMGNVMTAGVIAGVVVVRAEAVEEVVAAGPVAAAVADVAVLGTKENRPRISRIHTDKTAAIQVAAFLLAGFEFDDNVKD
jgi:hypothetical protein